MRRAVVSVLAAGASFAVVVASGGGMSSLRSLADDVLGTTPVAAHQRGTTAHHTSTPAVPTYQPVAPTTVDGTAENYGYGVIQVAVTFANHRVASVSVAHFVAADAYSASLEQAVVPTLEAEVLHAQGLPIDVVTGATYTSEAYATSLQAALDRERLAHP